jgi:hypothetical protein
MTVLPDEVAALAVHLGATGADGTVRLAQSGTMTGGPGRPWISFVASETVQTRDVAFEWRARTGPLSCLIVVDRLSATEAVSQLRLFGIFPLSGRPAHLAALQKGQVMRYLAEIPWAPDAIRSNRSLA